MNQSAIDSHCPFRDVVLITPRHALQVWIMVVVAVLSATMSESAIDSLQNAIVDNISGTFLKFLPLIWTRVLVCVLNIPVMVVSLQVTPPSNQISGTLGKRSHRLSSSSPSDLCVYLTRYCAPAAMC